LQLRLVIEKGEVVMDARKLAIGQGIFYVASGIWPIIDIRSFEKVTGPKTDKWLVKAVGALITAAGVAILQSGVRNKVTPETLTLAAGHALALGYVSGYYSSKGRISKIYALDSAVEGGLVAAWISVGRQLSAA
jgi:hypothetical protein